MPNLITRRSFLSTGYKACAAAGLASMTNIPLFLQRALAEGNIGISGKKLLFIFLRGGNDGINNILPIQDPSYLGTGGTLRGTIGIPKDPMVMYDMASTGADVVSRTYPYGIKLGNQFAALHPALFDMAPLFNSGGLALLHRVAYRNQSRSHFDSEKYWEKGTDGVTANNRLVADGVFYRTIVESGWNLNHALAGVSIQSNLSQSLRGQQPMTNLSSINRYNLLGVTPTTSTVSVCSNNFTFATDRLKLLNAIDLANLQLHPQKDNREMVYNLGTAFRDTLDIFQDCNFQSNEFYDTDGTRLFPSSTAQDPLNRFGGSFGFIQNVKSAAQILANTDAIITGTEMGGFDTHTAQVTPGSPHLGGHANLLRRLGWAYYALWKFFSNPAFNNQGRSLWNDIVVVTLSEFGRTSAENASDGTDHAEASVMYVAGGSIHGGVYGCSPTALNGVNQWDPGTGTKDGSMYAANNSVGYLRRAIDYRSVLGEIIRDHMGATQNQLNRIIPAYTNESVEHLLGGGPVGTTPIIGEVGIL